MFIKFCGFTRAADIEAARALPISAAGFIFYKKSKRYIAPDKAAPLTSMLRGTGIASTGIFVDDNAKTIRETAETAGLDIIQLYDHKTALELQGFRPLIICSRIGSGMAAEYLPKPDHDQMMLFDTYSEKNAGGTGEKFNWDILKGYNHADRLIVAGGLNAGNIKELITKIKPFGVDISSGIETSEGIKSEEKMLQIIKSIEEAGYAKHA